MSNPVARTRTGAAVLAVAGALFVLYPAVRPWHDESTVDGAIASMTSGRWVAAHAFAMVGFVLVPLGLLALRDFVARTRSESTMLAAVVLTWVGAGLVLPYYGAEDFALHAIASRAGRSPGLDVLGLVDATRFGAVQATMFAVGLLLLGVGAVLAAVGVWRCGMVSRSSGIVFAVGFGLFIPQFYGPAWVRIAHGVVVGVGLVWLALAMWRASVRSSI
jgi:hypothetical protein